MNVLLLHTFSVPLLFLFWDLIFPYILWSQSLQSLFSLSDSLFFILPGLLCHHLPHSCRGNHGSILSLKQLTSWLTLFGILFASPTVLSLNFMTPIYDLKFYDSDLCLQYASLRPLPSGPRLYFSFLTGHHKLGGKRHLKINMSNNKHMIYAVTLLPIKKSTLSLFFPESKNVYISHSVLQCRNKRFTRVLPFIYTHIHLTPKYNSASQIFLSSAISSFFFIFLLCKIHRTENVPS